MLEEEQVQAVGVVISESIVLAQEAAEIEAERLDRETADRCSEDVLPEVPRLLQLPQSTLVKKTHELKTKGKQLDLLLLKAETYSHFIAENQKRSQIRIVQKTVKPEDESSEMGSKRKASSSSPASKKSKAMVIDADGSAVDEQPPEASLMQQPSNLVGGRLLSYQLEGLQWLLSLWENGLSGILADEMGLGKTIQIISLIAHLRSSNTSGPFLIAAPLATIPNWINEFKKWLPSCPVVMYHGSQAERHQIRLDHMRVGSQKDMDFPVVVTSFEICMIDRQYLEKYTWQYLILDEGHRIKNRNCRLVRELKSIRSVSRLLLTGTPIQNTLEELWSLLNFCSPMIFDDLNVFQAWFGFKNIGRDTQVDEIIGNEKQERIVSKLHEILRPFLLRRMKRDVLLKMPPKQEIVVYCGMSAVQREYYYRVQQNTIRDTLVAMGVEKAKDISQSNMLMNLRKVCNHPFLFGEPKDENGVYLGMTTPKLSESSPHLLTKASGKFKLLDRMLPRLMAGNHKILIFSQMTELLNILEDYIIHLGHKYCRLDGSTKVEERQQAIDLFNSDPTVFIFILSTRAGWRTPVFFFVNFLNEFLGGLGINLTAADTCIIFDSDWNPHQDSQAQDRCHRIGQKKPVVVYRLLTAGSVEIEMMEKQISKKKLERLTIHGGDYSKAGQRAGSQLTLSRLRKLLEDDVRNLSRMGSGSDELTLAEAMAVDFDEAAAVDPSAPDVSLQADSRRNHFVDISDAELALIMNRDRLFPSFKPHKTTDVEDRAATVDGEAEAIAASDVKTNEHDDAQVVHLAIPLEGLMYDVVKAEAAKGVLQSLN